MERPYAGVVMIRSDGKCDACGHRGFIPEMHLEFTTTPGVPDATTGEPTAEVRTPTLVCTNCGTRHTWQGGSQARWS